MWHCLSVPWVSPPTVPWVLLSPGASRGSWFVEGLHPRSAGQGLGWRGMTAAIRPWVLAEPTWTAADLRSCLCGGKTRA